MPTHPLGSEIVPAPGPLPPFPSEYLDPLLEGFLREDQGEGDATSSACFPTRNEHTRADVICRERCTVAGLSVACRLFEIADGALIATPLCHDGERLDAGDRLISVEGPTVSLLAAERVALNLLQRLCGIATRTALYVDAVVASTASICDTRKTTPGLRLLEKYAVRCGGGVNHRFGLADGILIKDNHIAACGSVEEALSRAKKNISPNLKVEVEVERLSQIDEAVAGGADAILLDNMDLATLTEAVQRIAGRIPCEASGGIDLGNVGAVAATGVDFISVGGITHSAPSIDLSLEVF